MQPDSEIEAFYRKRNNDAGFDLFAAEDVCIIPGETKKVDTNIRLNIPEGHFVWMTGRSSLSLQGLFFHFGTIDAGYTGKPACVITNMSGHHTMIHRGDRIGQLVFLELIKVHMRKVDILPVTDRNLAGFGSSGIR